MWFGTTGLKGQYALCNSRGMVICLQREESNVPQSLFSANSNSDFENRGEKVVAETLILVKFQILDLRVCAGPNETSCAPH